MRTYDRIEEGARLGVEAQVLFWILGGLSVLALAAADVWTRRDAGAAAGPLGLGHVCFRGRIQLDHQRPVDSANEASAVGILIARSVAGTAERRKKRASAIGGGVIVALALLLARSGFSPGQSGASRGPGGQRSLRQGGLEQRALGLSILRDGTRRAGAGRAQARRPTWRFRCRASQQLRQRHGCRGDGVGVRRPAIFGRHESRGGRGFLQVRFFGPLPFVFGPVPPETVVVRPVKP